MKGATRQSTVVTLAKGANCQLKQNIHNAFTLTSSIQSSLIIHNATVNLQK